jgi:AsmA protein
LGGSTSIPARELDLKGTASLVSSSSEALFELPFVVGGTWDDPVVLPDPQILMRRSGATQPLLDIINRRRAPAAAAPAAAAEPPPQVRN